MDCSLPAPWIVAMPPQLCLTLCDPMEFSRKEYWSGLLFLTPGDLPNPGIEPRSPALQAESLLAQTVKSLPAMWETWVRFLGPEDPLEKEMATHSRFLPGKSHGQRTWWAAAHGLAKSWT